MTILEKIDNYLEEKWAKKVEIKHTGEHAGKSQAKLKKEIAALAIQAAQPVTAFASVKEGAIVSIGPTGID